MQCITQHSTSPSIRPSESPHSLLTPKPHPHPSLPHQTSPPPTPQTSAQPTPSRRPPFVPPILHLIYHNPRAHISGLITDAYSVHDSRLPSPGRCPAPLALFPNTPNRHDGLRTANYYVDCRKLQRAATGSGANARRAEEQPKRWFACQDDAGVRARSKGAREFRGVRGAWDVLGEGRRGEVGERLCLRWEDVGGRMDGMK